MLTPKSEEQLANEATVTRAAKELAKSHICDALAATIDELAGTLWRLSPGHRVGSMVQSKSYGRDIASGVMQTLLDTAPIDYRRLISEANEDEDMICEDSVVDDVRAYVDAIMSQWVKP